MDDKGYKGAPDLVVEVLSPSTAKHDRITKLNLYRQAGVREYWVVDPDTKTVQVCILKDGLYFILGYTDAETVPVSVLPGCEINLADVFAQ
jgi:Uma2 family endonuclease